MEQILVSQLVEATLMGDAWAIDTYLAQAGESSDPAHQVLAFDAVLDARGYNLLDLVWERIEWGWRRDQDLSFLVPVTLMLILEKGGLVGKAGLGVVHDPHELRTFTESKKARACMEHTLGLLALAAMGFNKLGQDRVKVSEHWAVQRLTSLVKCFGESGECRLPLVDEGFYKYLQKGSRLNAFVHRLLEGMGFNPGPVALLLTVLGQAGQRKQPLEVLSTVEPTPIYVPVAHVNNHRVGQWAHTPDISLLYAYEERVHPVWVEGSAF